MASARASLGHARHQACLGLFVPGPLNNRARSNRAHSCQTSSCFCSFKSYACTAVSSLTCLTSLRFCISAPLPPVVPVVACLRSCRFFEQPWLHICAGLAFKCKPLRPRQGSPSLVCRLRLMKLMATYWLYWIVDGLPSAPKHGFAFLAYCCRGKKCRCLPGLRGNGSTSLLLATWPVAVP